MIRGSLGLAGLAVLVGLGACQERDTVLPGKREPITAVLERSGSDTPELAREADNESRPIALPAPQTNESASQFEGSPSFRTDHPALNSNLTLAWSAKIGRGDERKQRITADPAVGGGRVYTLDAGTTVSAISPQGATIWQTKVKTAGDDDDDATGGGLAYADETLYVSSGFGILVAIDAASGALKWEQELDATGSGRPLVVGDLVYVTAGDEIGWAIERASGRIAWQTSAASSASNVLGAPSPVVTGDLVVFSFGSGELQAVFRRGGLRRWDSSVLGEREGRALSKVDDVTGTPVVVDGVLYAGSQAGRTVAINASSGGRIWTAREGAIGPVLPVGDSVFLVSDRNELLRLDAGDGSRIWGVRLPNFTARRPRSSAEVFAHHGPVLAGGRLYLASSDGLLRAYAPEDGSLLGTFAVPGGATTRPVVAGGTLYLVGRKGELHAFR